MTSKAEILRQLKPCRLCGNTLPIVRESIDFKKGSANNIFLVACAHKSQQPRRWKELATSWQYDAEILVAIWNGESNGTAE